MKETDRIDYYFGVSPLPEDTVTTMAYVPFQTDRDMFDDDTALCKGTVFINLNKPFCRGALK